MELKKKIKENQQRIKELGAEIEIHSANKQIPPEVSGEIQGQQDRLEFKLLKLEEQGQQEKIKTMEKVLKEVKSVSNIIKPN